MVQYFRGGPSRSALWAQMLGPAAGQGLGSMLSAYQTNKALEGVLNDPQYKDKSQGEKMGALQTALGRFGERGQKAIQQRLMAEQQLEQEARNKAENRFLSGAEDLSEREKSLIRPELRVQAMKAQAPKGGVSAQPVPPEIAQKIPQILNQNKNSTADELATAFDEAGIPRAYSNTYINNRIKLEESESSIPNLKNKKGIERDSAVMAAADAQRNTIPIEDASINAMKDAVINGDQDFFSWNNLAEKTGFEWARDAKGSEFKTASKTFLINNVTKFGARPNQYIEQQIADSLAKVGRNAQANLASIALTEFDVDTKRKYLEFIDQVEEEGDYKPGSLAKEAQKRMQSYVEEKQKELSNTLFELANGMLKPNETYVYDKDGIIAGTIDKNQVEELPEGYYVK